MSSMQQSYDYPLSLTITPYEYMLLYRSLKNRDDEEWEENEWRGVSEQAYQFKITSGKISITFPGTKESISGIVAQELINEDGTPKLGIKITRSSIENFILLDRMLRRVFKLQMDNFGLDCDFMRNDRRIEILKTFLNESLFSSKNVELYFNYYKEFSQIADKASKSDANTFNGKPVKVVKQEIMKDEAVRNLIKECNYENQRIEYKENLRINNAGISEEDGKVKAILVYGPYEDFTYLMELLVFLQLRETLSGSFPEAIFGRNIIFRTAKNSEEAEADLVKEAEADLVIYDESSKVFLVLEITCSSGKSKEKAFQLCRLVKILQNQGKKVLYANIVTPGDINYIQEEVKGANALRHILQNKQNPF